jgi:colanic acid biosynthesis glycosyl transferase WcaI
LTHVLILSLDFPPDNVSTGHLMGDLASDLVERGHKVAVITTRPHARRDPVAEGNQPLRRLWGPFLSRSDYHGVPVYHTLMSGRSTNIISRLIPWLMFHVIALVAGLFIPRRVDVILTPSPLLSLGVVAWLIGLRHRCRFVYNVQDLHPDSASSMGRINNPAFRWVLYRMESFVYRTAAAVTAITPGIKRRIESKGISPDKVVYIPNWVDTDREAPVDKSNPFAIEHGLDSQFVVSYAGTLGMAQSFDEFLEAARILKSHSHIQFLIVGEGTRRENISETIENLKLVNVHLLPNQPQQMMPMIYGTSDMSFVTLLPELGDTALPSKVYRIMSTVTPVLAITEAGSGLSDLILEAQCGAVVEPGSGAELASVIEKFASDPEMTKQAGLAGRRFAQDSYSRPDLVSRYIELFDRIVKRE